MKERYMRDKSGYTSTGLLFMVELFTLMSKFTQLLKK